MVDTGQRRLLGEFVRAHRERQRPVNAAGRRRTPGLRREELAEQAGISTTWCAWIEQGRAVQASPSALSRLARALALSAAERAYLFELAGCLDPSFRRNLRGTRPLRCRPPSWGSNTPHTGLDRLWNACCWNAAAASLFRGWLDGDHQRNLLRFVFLNSSARKLIPRWEDRARRLLAEFRADYSHNFRDLRVGRLWKPCDATVLSSRKRGDKQDVQYRSGGVRSFSHPDDGPLRFEQHTFSASDGPITS